MTTQNIYDMVDVWNNAGVAFAGIKMNVTDTASLAASLLIDLQVGGVTKFKVDKVGTITAEGGITARGQFLSSPQGTLNLASQNALILMGTTSDLYLYRDAGDTFAQRRTVNPQTFNIYNTWTDASNYERGKLQWAGNGFTIGTEAAGTGIARNMTIRPGGLLFLGGSNTLTWQYSGTAMLAVTDNTVDIGQSGANRPRNLYLAGFGIIGAGLQVSGNLGVGIATVPSALMQIANASTTRSQIRFSTGVAPTTPVDGDMWFDGTNLKLQVAGVTKTFTLT